MLRASARISFRRRPRSAVLETKSTFFPTNLDSSSSASKCPKRLTFASGMNSTSKSISRSEEHTSELQSLRHLVCRLLLEKKKTKNEITSVIDVGDAPHSKQGATSLP